MQYILTEEEINDLRNKKEKWDEAEKEELQNLCTLAAEHIPVLFDWTTPVSKGILGCILNKTTGYCDECPSQEVCPYPHKSWSK